MQRKLVNESFTPFDVFGRECDAEITKRCEFFTKNVEPILKSANYNKKVVMTAMRIKEQLTFIVFSVSLRNKCCLQAIKRLDAYSLGLPVTAGPPVIMMQRTLIMYILELRQMMH